MNPSLGLGQSPARQASLSGFIAKVVLLALVCFGLAYGGHFLAAPPNAASPFWPPAGLAIAVFLLWGLRFWPAIAIGLAAASRLHGEPLVTNLGFALGGTLAGIVGAQLLKRFRVDPRLGRLMDLLGYIVLGAFLSPVVSATIGGLTLAVSGSPPSASGAAMWWIGDALGALLVGPLLLVWAQPPVIQERRGRLELAAFVVVLLGLTGSAFLTSPLPYPYLLFIPAVWSGLRFGMRGTTVSLLLMAGAIVTAAMNGHGLIAPLPNDVSLLLALVSVLTITSLILAAVTTERSTAEARLVADAVIQRAVIAGSPLAIVALDSAGRVTGWNTAAEEIFGYERSEVMGRTPPFAREDQGRDSGTHQAALSGRAFNAVSARRQRKDGTWVELALSTAPLRDEAGQINGVLEIFADLTERQRSDGAVRESEARLKLILEQALDAVITMDDEGRITGWNSQAERIFGWNSTEVMGRRVSETIIPVRMREAHDKGLRRFLTSGVSVVQGRRMELLGLHRSGHEFPVELTVGSARLGQEMVFSAFLRDITEQKRAEHALRASEDRYRAFISQSTEAVWCFEFELAMPVTLPEDEQIEFIYRHGYLSECNDEMARMYGLAHAGELIGLRPADLLIRSDPRNLEFLLAFIRSGYRLTDAESHQLDRDGRSKYFLNNLVGIIENGLILRAWGTQRDITARRRAEQRAVAFASLAHRLSGAKAPVEAARIIADVAQSLCGWEACSVDLYSMEHDRIDAVLTIDLVDGKPVELPPAYSGQPPSDMGRRVIDEGPQLILTPGSASLIFVPIPNRSDVIGLLSIQSYQPNAYTPEDLRLVQTLADQCGAALERIRAEEELRHAEDQLRQAQKMEAVGRLAGGIAHDFNNLLTTILGTCELLMKEVPPGGRWTEDLEEIRKAGERAAGLTRQLLAFSRKQVIEAAPLDLNETVTSVGRMLHRLIGEDIHLITKLTPDVGMVRADSGQLEQVIINLAVNARDAMPQGGTLIIETANVVLEAEEKGYPAINAGPYVRLSVSDTGIGMDPETRSHIFEPFFTTKEQGKGTGLGLATVYGIVRQSGGHVAVYSEPGLGAAFTIYLPRIGDGERPLPARPARSPRPGWETILLAEDEPAVRSLTQRILESTGYQVLAAASGDEALFLARQHEGPVHLLITDVVMPGMSGPQLAERLNEERKDTKVLYMSGYTDTAILHHGVPEQGISYLQKPFSPAGLGEKVREVLERQTTTEQGVDQGREPV